jgi:5-methyltetrahydrofolate--homocysteine methyltransferase
MTTTMRRMEDAVGLVAEMQLGVPVMVGGAVVSDEYARSIGAAYAPDAVAAVDLARKLVAKSAEK